jgi:hypothetical protein
MTAFDTGAKTVAEQVSAHMIVKREGMVIGSFSYSIAS